MRSGCSIALWPRIWRSARAGPIGQQIGSFCNQKSCLPNVNCHSAQLLTVQELVALGHGVSLISRMAAADRGNRRKCRPLNGERPSRTLAMIRRKGRFQSPLVGRFLERLRDVAAQSTE